MELLWGTYPDVYGLDVFVWSWDVNIKTMPVIAFTSALITGKLQFAPATAFSRICFSPLAFFKFILVRSLLE